MSKNKGQGTKQALFFTNGLYTGNNDVTRIRGKSAKNKYNNG